jgi:hypothetical protein
VPKQSVDEYFDLVAIGFEHGEYPLRGRLAFQLFDGSQHVLPAFWAYSPRYRWRILKLPAADVAIMPLTNALSGPDPVRGLADLGLLPPRSGLSRLLCRLAPAFVDARVGGEDRSAHHIFGIAVGVVQRSVRQNAY